MASIIFAPIREQGVEFVAVVARDSVVTFPQEGNKTISALERQFGRPVILVGERNRRWYGRKDLAEFMSNVPVDRIPWRRGTIN